MEFLHVVTNGHSHIKEGMFKIEVHYYFSPKKIYPVTYICVKDIMNISWACSIFKRALKAWDRLRTIICSMYLYTYDLYNTYDLHIWYLISYASYTRKVINFYYHMALIKANDRCQRSCVYLQLGECWVELLSIGLWCSTSRRPFLTESPQVGIFLSILMVFSTFKYNCIS